MIYLSKKDEAIPVIERDAHDTKEEITLKPIQYISNGKTLKYSHGQYYSGILNLDPYDTVNANIIENAAEKRRSLINKIQEAETLVSSRDVAAAKFYLLDQWSYFTSVN